MMVSKWSGLEFSNWMSKITTLNQQNIKSEPLYCQTKPSLVRRTVRSQSLLMTALVWIGFIRWHDNSSLQKTVKVGSGHRFLRLLPRKGPLRTSKIFCDTGYQALVIFLRLCFMLLFLQFSSVVSSCCLSFGCLSCLFHFMWSLTMIPGLSKGFVPRK